MCLASRPKAKDYGPSLHRVPNGSKISVLIFKATICSYNVFVLIRNICHLGADSLQKSVHSSGTRRKILFFLGNVGTSSGQLNEFQPPLVPFQFGNLVQGAACPVQQYLLALPILWLREPSWKVVVSLFWMMDRDISVFP